MIVYPVQVYIRDFIRAFPAELDSIKHTALRKVAKPLKFPLTDRDKKIIRKLRNVLNIDERLGSVSAPQLGISKRVFAIDIPTIPGLKEQGIQNSIFINPSFEPVGPERELEGEECYSIRWSGAYVPRYWKIKYKAFTEDGQLMEGVAENWVARTIQHEIDHLDGILYPDRVLQRNF